MLCLHGVGVVRCCGAAVNCCMLCCIIDHGWICRPIMLHAMLYGVAYCDMVLHVQEQSKLMWKYRDELQNSLSKSEMHQLLETNHQSVPKGEAKASHVCGGVLGVWSV